MSKFSFTYAVSAHVRFTAGDLRVIKECSEYHYDAKCRGFFDAGKKGNGLRNSFSLEDGTHIDPLSEECPADLETEFPAACTAQDLGTLSKILTMGHHLPHSDRSLHAATLKTKMHETLTALQAESARLNESDYQ